nr:DUF86 domain-containing protein [Candidatus Freyarchaeota archaeon]
MARFRHVLAHVYTKLDLNLVYGMLHHDLEEIKEFLRVLAAKLQERNIEMSEF